MQFAIAFALFAVLRATPADPALDALVATAIESAPELAAARAEVDAAKRRIEPARALADPMLSTTYQNDGRALSLGSAEGSFVGLMLSQPLPWPGKRELAAREATSEAREIETGALGRAALSIEARVRNAWYDVALARALDRLIDERRETARQIEETTRARYAAGLAVQQDVLRAQVELARIEEMKSAQRATIAAREAELQRLTGATTFAATLPEIAPVPADAIANVLQRSPELAAARQGMATSRVRVDIAKKNFRPDFVVSGGSMYRGRFEMGPMWQIGAGVSLPLWSDKKQQNQLAEAEARTRESSAQADVVERDVALRTRERIAQLEAANETAALYRDKVVPLDQLAVESALASYRAGKVPFVSVLDAVNALYADRSTYLGRLAEAAKWRVAIDEAR
ncbi:MAG TPA: TolC family protein [Thermoanaerobaculia bacterium]|nr:TolC family protein [Thermoanaerobaculia bacterium]